MSLDKAMKNLKFDSRLLEFHLRTGVISKEDWQKHLSQLPDSSANSLQVDLEEGSDIDDEVDEIPEETQIN